MSRRTSHPLLSRRRLAFSLVELLVVIAILAILVAAGVPAIRNMIYTSTGSMAESQLRFALGASRDLAIRNASGDTAAVFTFEPGGRLTIIPMVYVGQILDTKDPDQPLSTTTFSGYRDVFAPSALVEPFQLPAGWMVRGFAPAGYIFADGPNNDTPTQTVKSNGWYFENTASGNRRANLATDNISGLPSRGNWVFPETAFFDPTVTDQGQSPRPNSRNTFMVRFQSGTGRIVGVGPNPSIVLLPRSNIDNTNGKALAKLSAQSTPWVNGSDWRRIDRTDNLVSWARGVCDQVPAIDASALIGCRSADAAMASSVNIIALYDESKMAISLGARGLNKLTGTIYGGAVTGVVTSNANEIPKAPNIDVSLWPAGTTIANAGSPDSKAETVQMLINNYMLNALKNQNVAVGTGTDFVNSDARLFTVDTYLGSVSEAK